MLTNLLRPPWRLPYNSPVTAVIDCFLVLQQSPTRPLGIDWAAPFPSPLRGFKNPKSSPLEVKSICSDVGCGRFFFSSLLPFFRLSFAFSLLPVLVYCLVPCTHAHTSYFGLVFLIKHWSCLFAKEKRSVGGASGTSVRPGYKILCRKKDLFSVSRSTEWTNDPMGGE